MNISKRLKEDGIIKNYNIKPDFRGGKLNIELTSMCNEKCIYCTYSANGLHKKHKTIEKDFFYRITKEAHELGIEEIGLYVTAEPLMNPDIYDYVRYLKQDIGFKYVYISTNGILLNQKNLKRLVGEKYGIDSIKFSISGGNRESFQRHHGIDAFDIVKQNVEDAFRYREKMGLNYKLFLFSIVTKFNQTENQEIKENFGRYVDETIFIEVQDDIIPIKGIKEYLKLTDYTILAGEGERKIPCPQLFNRIIIDEDGYLCACCYSEKDLTKVINLKDISLREGVYSEEMIKLRRRHMEGDIENIICNRCVNQIVEQINPLTDKYGFQPVNIESLDFQKEIRKRFEIS